MTNHAPTFTGSSATGSFSEFSNTTDSTALHTLTGTLNFKDSDHTDTHTTSASLRSAVLSSGSIIPSTSLSHFQTAMTSQITSDSNGTGQRERCPWRAHGELLFLSCRKHHPRAP